MVSMVQGQAAASPDLVGDRPIHAGSSASSRHAIPRHNEAGDEGTTERNRQESENRNHGFLVCPTGIPLRATN